MRGYESKIATSLHQAYVKKEVLKTEEAEKVADVQDDSIVRRSFLNEVKEAELSYGEKDDLAYDCKPDEGKTAEKKVECEPVIEKDEIGTPVDEVNDSIDAKSVAGSSRLSAAPDVGKTNVRKMIKDDKVVKERVPSAIDQLRSMTNRLDNLSNVRFTNTVAELTSSVRK